MVHPNVDVFLSCSFHADDAPVNDLVRGVCGGLGLRALNVAAGYAELPPDKAREMIAKSAGLIAVVTRREPLESGDFAMPSAVREEISIAFGLQKRILILGEEGVRFDGFMNNYGPRLPFARSDLSSPGFVEKLVSSVFAFRQGAIASSESSLLQYATEYYSESSRSMVSLERENGEYWWSTVSTKRLRFEQTLQRDITSSVWPTNRRLMPSDAPLALWNVRIEASSRPFEVQAAVREHQADRVGLSLRFSPNPQPGDFIEFTREVRSRYLNPTFQSDLPPGTLPPLTIAGRDYCVADGVLTVERTESLHLYYSFPRGYNLRPEDVAPFVASHSSYIDYPAPWELDRLNVQVESFGSQLIANLRVENPVPRHLYGLAWNPPAAPAGEGDGDASTASGAASE